MENGALFDGYPAKKLEIKKKVEAVKTESTDEIIRVESFSKSGEFYNVNKTKKTCTCPAFTKNRYGDMCKHLKRVFGIKDTVGGFSKSLLKSALQKAVRRSEPEKAVKCAKGLMELDEIDFLRRVLVVVMEDGLLHPSLGVVKDMLVNLSTKKTDKLTEEDKDVIMNMVWEVAECEWRDDWVDENEGEMDNPEEKEAIKYEEETPQAWKEMGEEERNLVMAIKYRSKVGGMKGDIVMLEHYYRLWLKRFGKGEWNIEKLKAYFKPKNLKWKDVIEVTKSDIILESADMHCSPLLDVLLKKEWVVDLIKSKFPKFSDAKEKLNDLMWRQMSSINYKKEIGTGKVRNWYEKGRGKDVDKYDEDMVWMKIKSEANNISRWFINKQVEEKDI